MIRPALEQGKTVISDRYVISTLVYGEALGLDPEWLLRVNTPFVEPDVVIVALPRFDICTERVQKREQLDVFESTPFQKRIYELYERVIRSDPSVKHVDTAAEQTDTAEQIWQIVKSL